MTPLNRLLAVMELMLVTQYFGEITMRLAARLSICTENGTAGHFILLAGHIILRDCRHIEGHWIRPALEHDLHAAQPRRHDRCCLADQVCFSCCHLAESKAELCAIAHGTEWMRKMYHSVHQCRNALNTGAVQGVASSALKHD